MLGIEAKHLTKRKEEGMLSLEPTKWIIESLLDTDFYKFTMGNLVWNRYRDVPVRYAMTLRTKGVNLATFIDESELREELDHVRTLRFTKTELHYLRGTNEYGDRMFPEGYLEFLAALQLPEYVLKCVEGGYALEFPGKWSEAIYWETFGLSIVNELYYRALLRKMSRFQRETVAAEGVRRLAEKNRVLKEHPEVTVCDFGTRRRFSRTAQAYVVGVQAEELPPSQFLGTSNTLLAMKYGLLPMGTYAHETGMAMSGIMHGSDEEIRASHNRVLQDWWDQYGWGLSIALTDTYGTDFFFRDMTPEQARNWKGLRQDSGDPIEFGEKALRFYRKCGVDPRDKLQVFSDGLTVEAMIKITQYFSGRIRTTFGWGTNLTNDFGFPALSLVIKLIEANGWGTVKLSDNIAKAIGKLEDVERFKRIFGYTSTLNEVTMY